MTKVPKRKNRENGGEEINRTTQENGQFPNRKNSPSTHKARW